MQWLLRRRRAEQKRRRKASCRGVSSSPHTVHLCLGGAQASRHCVVYVSCSIRNHYSVCQTCCTSVQRFLSSASRGSAESSRGEVDGDTQPWPRYCYQVAGSHSVGALVRQPRGSTGCAGMTSGCSPRRSRARPRPGPSSAPSLCRAEVGAAVIRCSSWVKVWKRPAPS